MKKAGMIWLIVAASLILLGAIGMVVTMSMSDWQFSKLGSTSYGTKVHTVNEEFRDLLVKTDTADLRFALSEDGVCRVECYESEKQAHKVTVEGKTLTIRSFDARRWYEHIGINWETPKVTVYLPKEEYETLSIRESTGDVVIEKELSFRSMEIQVSTGDVKNYASVTEAMKIKSSTGSVLVENVTADLLSIFVSTGRVEARSVTCAGELSLTVSTGKARLTDVSCGKLLTSGDTGDLNLVRVVAEESFAIERSTGDVTLESCDAAEILIKTDTGDVEGSLRSEKIFFASSDTGRVNVPKTVNGGRCEVKTDTGHIELRVEQS